MFEADVVYTGIKRSPALEILHYQQGTALSHYLALDHSRHNRIPREMSLTEEFIFSDAV